LNAINPATTTRLFGLFKSSHMSYDLDRAATSEPSIAEMTSKAMDGLPATTRLFPVGGSGRIDHALHETTAKKALQIPWHSTTQSSGDRQSQINRSPVAEHLIVVTADHDTRCTSTVTQNAPVKPPLRTGCIGSV